MATDPAPDLQSVIGQIREGQLRDRALRQQLAAAVPKGTAVLVHADDGSYVIVVSDQRVYEIPIQAVVDYRAHPGGTPALPVIP